MCDTYDAYEFTIKYNVDQEPLFFRSWLYFFGLGCLVCLFSYNLGSLIQIIYLKKITHRLLFCFWLLNCRKLYGLFT